MPATYSPATAIKRRRLSFSCEPSYTVEVPEDDMGIPDTAERDASKDEVVFPAHASFREARHRLQHACNLEDASVRSPEKVQFPCKDAGTGEISLKEDRRKGQRENRFAPICYGFFSKQAGSARCLPPLPTIRSTQRANTAFCRTPGFYVVCPPICRGEDCQCSWCSSRKSLAEERAELMMLYREAKAAGHVVDPAE